MRQPQSVPDQDPELWVSAPGPSPRGTWGHVTPPKQVRSGGLLCVSSLGPLRACSLSQGHPPQVPTVLTSPLRVCSARTLFVNAAPADPPAVPTRRGGPTLLCPLPLAVVTQCICGGLSPRARNLPRQGPFSQFCPRTRPQCPARCLAPVVLGRCLLKENYERTSTESWLLRLWRAEG